MTEDKKNPLGPTGERVQRRVERLRTARGMSKKDLSDRTSELGRPIPPLGVSRIEAGSRRVDADDLVALADALNVSPLTLLLPPTANDEVVELTAEHRVTARTAWAWGQGRQTAMDRDAGGVIGEDPDGIQAELDRRHEQKFRRAQAEYEALATPADLREDHRAVQFASELRDLIAEAVATPPGPDGAQEDLLLKARRRWEQVGLELEEVAERYSIRFSVGGPPGDPNARFMRPGRFFEVPPPPPASAE